MNQEIALEPIFNTAVLFLIFNRPDTTKQVFEAIRQAKPPRLYVAADGVRHGREGEGELVKQARSIATSVDWPCEVQTLFRAENLGCKQAVSEAIDWFFENEAQGIILEDDCLPNPDFFIFCQTLLYRYADDVRVWVVTGDNFQDGRRRGDASYYFSRYNHVWGWASWRRAWIKRDMSLSFWPEFKKSADWREALPDPIERRYWTTIFEKMYLNKIDAWDYPWTACVWYGRGLTVTPNVNLVSNIGFGANSTHTKSIHSPLASMRTHAIGDLVHPREVMRDAQADRYAFDFVFGGRQLRFPYFLLRIVRGAAKFAYRHLKRSKS